MSGWKRGVTGVAPGPLAFEEINSEERLTGRGCKKRQLECNAGHFKLKENLNYWSERPSKYKDFTVSRWWNLGVRDMEKDHGMGLGRWRRARSQETSRIITYSEQTPARAIRSHYVAA